MAAMNTVRRRARAYCRSLSATPSCVYSLLRTLPSCVYSLLRAPPEATVQTRHARARRMFHVLGSQREEAAGAGLRWSGGWLTAVGQLAYGARAAGLRCSGGWLT
eukprot:5063448-Pyramimonas_sp.AAC.1